MNKTNESPKPHSLLRSSFLKPRPQMQSGNTEGPVEKSLCFVNTLEMTDSHLGSDFSGKSKFNWHINWAGVYLSEKKKMHSADHLLRFDPLMKNRLNLAEGRTKQAGTGFTMCKESNDCVNNQCQLFFPNSSYLH